jgi:hypothetical protein
MRRRVVLYKFTAVLNEYTVPIFRCESKSMQSKKLNNSPITRNSRSIDHAASVPHKTTQHNNTNNRHPGDKKDDKFVLKKQLTEMNLANNRRIRRKNAWSTRATATKLNRAYDTFKLKIIIMNFDF